MFRYKNSPQKYLDILNDFSYSIFPVRNISWIRNRKRFLQSIITSKEIFISVMKQVKEWSPDTFTFEDRVLFFSNHGITLTSNQIDNYKLLIKYDTSSWWKSSVRTELHNATAYEIFDIAIGHIDVYENYYSSLQHWSIKPIVSITPENPNIPCDIVLVPDVLDTLIDINSSSGAISVNKNCSETDVSSDQTDIILTRRILKSESSSASDDLSSFVENSSEDTVKVKRRGPIIMDKPVAFQVSDENEKNTFVFDMDNPSPMLDIDGGDSIIDNLDEDSKMSDNVRRINYKNLLLNTDKEFLFYVKNGSSDELTNNSVEFDCDNDDIVILRNTNKDSFALLSENKKPSFRVITEDENDKFKSYSENKLNDDIDNVLFNDCINFECENDVVVMQDTVQKLSIAPSETNVISQTLQKKKIILGRDNDFEFCTKSYPNNNISNGLTNDYIDTAHGNENIVIVKNNIKEVSIIPYKANEPSQILVVFNPDKYDAQFMIYKNFKLTKKKKNPI